MKAQRNWEAQARFTRFLNGERLASAAKKGMASFYVVIFAMLVFIVLVLAFINIMISETLQSSGSDLSASALDSAQAGVEDAKTALMQCLSESSFSTNALSNCSSELFSGNCDSVSQYLYGESEEVQIGDTSLNQAYTCVTLDNEVDSLISTLNPNTSNGAVFIVPLYKADGNYTAFRISWYSEDDREASGGTSMFTSAPSFPNATSMSSYMPMLQVHMISAETGSGVPATIANSATDLGMAVLVPVSSAGTGGMLYTGTNYTSLNGTIIKKNFTYFNSTNSSRNYNRAVSISCDTTQEYACIATVTNAASVDYLIITNPYNDREVTVEVEACSNASCTTTYSFTNVQVEVDSTGRASNYYRRVQTRLTLADPDVPVPTYALNLSGSDGLSKYFAVTRNCWTISNNEIEFCDDGTSL